MKNIASRAVANESSLGQSSLVSRNVTILGRRTSIRLEPEMWQALNDIAERERCSVHDICTLVSVCKKNKTSFTAAIRVFLMLYFRAASTEHGHVAAGHGDFRSMIMRARMPQEYKEYFESNVFSKKFRVLRGGSASRSGHAS